MRMDELNQLLNITNEQKLLLVEGRYEEFIELLVKRQEIIDKINEINKLHNTELSVAEKDVLEKIINIDRQNREEYNRQLEEAKENLRKLNESRNRELNYMSPYMNYSSGRNFDSK